jgi:hypothetical protein
MCPMPLIRPYRRAFLTATAAAATATKAADAATEGPFGKKGGGPVRGTESLPLGPLPILAIQTRISSLSTSVSKAASAPVPSSAVARLWLG